MLIAKVVPVAILASSGDIFYLILAIIALFFLEIIVDMLL